MPTRISAEETGTPITKSERARVKSVAHIAGRTEGCRQARTAAQQQMIIKYKGKRAMAIIKLGPHCVRVIPSMKTNALPIEAADPISKALRYVRRRAGVTKPL